MQKWPSPHAGHLRQLHEATDGGRPAQSIASSPLIVLNGLGAQLWTPISSLSVLSMSFTDHVCCDRHHRSTASSTRAAFERLLPQALLYLGLDEDHEGVGYPPSHRMPPSAAYLLHRAAAAAAAMTDEVLLFWFSLGFLVGFFVGPDVGIKKASSRLLQR